MPCTSNTDCDTKEFPILLGSPSSTCIVPRAKGEPCQVYQDCASSAGPLSCSSLDGGTPVCQF
jgi:hypothetical protein